MFGPAKLCMQPGMATGLKQAQHLRKDKKEERLEISSRKLETSKEHFIQRWAQSRIQMKEAEEIKTRCQDYTEELYQKKILNT